MTVETIQTLQAAAAAMTATGLIGGYILSIEKRLNGRAALKKSVDEVKTNVKEFGDKLDTVAIHVARIDTYLAARREFEQQR